MFSIYPHSNTPSVFEMNSRIKWCLIGIPDHEGVFNSGGRIDSAGGPDAFLRVFNRLNGRDRVHESLNRRRWVDGMVRDVERNHRMAASEISAAHRECAFSVVVGGGHDHGFSHLKGLQVSFPGK